ncbi:22364_t:CDS:2 [Racocetra persica]|uniref:22364_t:CDS:1 n=1 Tax=Racocetra persica TaxID=160502 RepID=A0ACA9LVE7_9GLOM|nr:22364_t:CDS:2 [Racocetra persica]
MGKAKGNVWKHWTILNTKNQPEASYENCSEDNSDDHSDDCFEENDETLPKKNITKPHPRVKCNYCSKTFERGLASRIQMHLNSCLKAPNNAKANLKRKNSTTSGKSTQKYQKTMPIDNFIDNVNENEQETLEFMLAQAIFATGTSFAFIENPYVIKFFQRIRPAFKLPTRKKLANELLDKVYENVKAESDKKILQAQKVALVIPAITRWGTHLECFQSLQKSQIAIEQTLMDLKIRQTMDSNLRIHVLQDEFWENLNLVTDILTPIVTILKLFESNESTLSSIYSNFRKMKNSLQKIPIAYMMDPRFLDESKDFNVEAMGYNTFTTYCNNRFEQNKSVKLFVELVTFRNKNPPYDNEIIWKSAIHLLHQPVITKEDDEYSEFDQDIEKEIYNNISEIIDSENEEIYEASNADNISAFEMNIDD